MSVVEIHQEENWEEVCSLQDLVPGSGSCALVQGHQLAIFYLPSEEPALYALSNHDPIGLADVMSRGILGSIGGDLVITSPLFKQHYSLTSGVCLEQPEYALDTFCIREVDGKVQVLATTG